MGDCYQTYHRSNQQARQSPQSPLANPPFGPPRNAASKEHIIALKQNQSHPSSPGQGNQLSRISPRHSPIALIAPQGPTQAHWTLPMAINARKTHSSSQPGLPNGANHRSAKALLSNPQDHPLTQQRRSLNRHQPKTNTASDNTPTKEKRLNKLKLPGIPKPPRNAYLR